LREQAGGQPAAQRQAGQPAERPVAFFGAPAATPTLLTVSPEGVQVLFLLRRCRPAVVCFFGHHRAREAVCAAQSRSKYAGGAIEGCRIAYQPPDTKGNASGRRNPKAPKQGPCSLVCPFHSSTDCSCSPTTAWLLCSKPQAPGRAAPACQSSAGSAASPAHSGMP